MADPDNGITLTEDQKRRRTARNWALAGVLLVLVVLFYLLTLFKVGGNIVNRPL